MEQFYDDLEKAMADSDSRSAKELFYFCLQCVLMNIRRAGACSERFLNDSLKLFVCKTATLTPTIHLHLYMGCEKELC